MIMVNRVRCVLLLSQVNQSNVNLFGFSCPFKLTLSVLYSNL